MNQTKASTAASWAWGEQEPRAAAVGMGLSLQHCGSTLFSFESAAACL